MKPYVILLRGINVGGNSKVPMAELRKHLEELGFSNVTTYIASGNVILQSDKSVGEVKTQIVRMLFEVFMLDDVRNKVLVLSKSQLQEVVDSKPKGFGDKKDIYHSDVIFLIDIDATEAMTVFKPREGVDKVWPGKAAIYSQRLSAERTKSRLSKIVGTPAYQSMTIRTWGTTTKLLEILKETDSYS